MRKQASKFRSITEPQTWVGKTIGMPVNNNRNQSVDFTEVIENYGKITCGAHNFGKNSDSVIRRSLRSTKVLKCQASRRFMVGLIYWIAIQPTLGVKAALRVLNRVMIRIKTPFCIANQRLRPWTPFYESELEDEDTDNNVVGSRYANREEQ